MKTRWKPTTLAVLPVAGFLLMAPVASAHDERRQEHRAAHRDLNAAHDAEHHQLRALQNRGSDGPWSRR